MTISGRTSNPWADLREAILEEADSTDWTAAERNGVREFAKSLVRADHGELVFRYLKLVQALTSPYGRDKSAVLAEGGRLIDWLDPHAYDGIPAGELIDPVEFVTRRLGNAAFRKRLDGWAQEIPKRLRALRLEMLRTTAANIYNLPVAIQELVRAVPKGQRLPDGISEIIDAIRRGRTSIAYVDQPGLAAFFWPISQIDLPALLGAKEAVALLKSLGKPVSERTVRERGKAHPKLKQGTKFIKAEVVQAANDGVFGHGNATPK